MSKLLVEFESLRKNHVNSHNFVNTFVAKAKSKFVFEATCYVMKFTKFTKFIYEKVL